MNELKDRYQQHIVPALMKELKITNKMALPKVKKIIINVGVPKTETTPQSIETISQELASITGQMPQVTQAKKSIAGFKIRQGDPVGVAVTLRGDKMLDFLDKLCRIVLPQVKDFKGVKATAFDGHGNYSLGLTEQLIFPEIDYSKVNQVHGLEITIVTSTEDDDQAKKLLELIGIPFEKPEITNN